MGPFEEKGKEIDWARLPLHPSEQPNDKEPVVVQVSNPYLHVPEGLKVLPNFSSVEELRNCVLEADKGESAWEGFEQRRRVQRWRSEDPSLPSALKHMCRRLGECIGHLPQHVTIEEYPKSQLQRHFSISQSTVTTFESTTLCHCEDQHCCCFVAVLPIASSVIENINRPKRRSADCWDLYSYDHHKAGLVLNPGSLFIKRKEFLWQWRSRISAAGPLDKEGLGNGKAEPSSAFSQRRFIVVKFSKFHITSPSSQLPQSTRPGFTPGPMEDLSFGYLPKPEDLVPQTGELPPLEQLLTVIVTTSPIKSNPSTELLERVFQTFFHGGKDFAIKCPKVIVCDGCREKNEGVSKRHANSKQAMRNGIVDSEQARNYVSFKAALRELCSSAPSDSPFSNTEVVELETRHGYGFALRHALQECVCTPYVIVIQHDRTFMRPCPIFETVQTMWNHKNVKYVGMSMRSNLMYRDIFLGKYGRSYMKEMAACTLRPSELALDAKNYGPNSTSTQSMDYAGQEKLRENILALMETYRTSQQNMDHLEWVRENTVSRGKWQCSLTPTFFWYDNVHICEVQHYRDFVFHPPYKMVVRGGFVEDKLSPVIKKTVERMGLAEGHSRFGCYLLDDHSGMFFTGHLDGGSYLTKAEKEALSSRKEKARS